MLDKTKLLKRDEDKFNEHTIKYELDSNEQKEKYLSEYSI